MVGSQLKDMVKGTLVKSQNRMITVIPSGLLSNER